MMVKYMKQQGWLVVEDVTMVGHDAVREFATFKDYGTFEAKLMMHTLRILRGSCCSTIG
jgi:hypothetical protein